jgi:N-dimethylarginine dimethylaminohydrolase
MTPDLLKLSAYHGAGWRARSADLGSEIDKQNGIWSALRVDSEYKPLKAVLLYCPGLEVNDVQQPDSVQHIARINPEAARREYKKLHETFRLHGVAVHYIRPDALQPGTRLEKYNLMFARDLFFNTKEGAVVARMGSAVRAGEEKFAQLALAQLAIPINKTITNHGIFEGADALWINPKTVLCGLGRRTNREGFQQVRAVLKAQEVEALAVDLPAATQHLLGVLHIVDKNLALVRTRIVPKRMVNILRRAGISIIDVPETEEVLVRQGMNVVTVKPRVIIMPVNCPDLKLLYEASGITVAAEVEIGQILNGAGGLACATGILAREI